MRGQPHTINPILRLRLWYPYSLSLRPVLLGNKSARMVYELAGGKRIVNIQDVRRVSVVSARGAMVAKLSSRVQVGGIWKIASRPGQHGGHLF